ncbi:MAG: carbohydrate-binding protein, partial [Verrucomicrobiales bacterium]|nr:carbohydrate-binding protein [Verrucomicrobiales bacterium]
QFSPVYRLSGGGWETKGGVSRGPSFDLEPGVYTVRLAVSDGDLVLDWFEFARETKPGPFRGIARTIPGRIEAEDFDEGGNLFGYFDGDASNHGGQYRPEEGVDIEVCTDVGGGYDVGWNRSAEAQFYTVNVSRAAVYRLKARVAAVSPENRLLVSVMGSAVDWILDVPSTGGYQEWVDLEGSLAFDEKPIAEGPQRLEVRWLYADGTANLNWLEFTEAGATPPVYPVITWADPLGISAGTALSSAQLNAKADVAGAFSYDPPVGTVLPPGDHLLTATFTPTESGKYLAVTRSVRIQVARVPRVPFGGTPHQLPGRIRAEHFDEGGEGFSYHDVDASNRGGAARLLEGVDLEPCFDEGGGANLAWTRTGEWVEYTVEVVRAAHYQLRTRVASEATGGALTVRVSPSGAAGSSTEWKVSVPVTGGWQKWTTVGVSPSGPVYPLSAGRHVVRLTWDSSEGTANLNWLEFVEVRTVPVLTWADPAEVVYGTALGEGQLNAKTDARGTIRYEPAAGTVPGAGTHTLTAIFTPDDPTANATATATVTLVVTRAPLVIQADDKSMTAGDSVPALTASYAGFVNGEGPEVLTTKPRLSTGVGPATGAGSYGILVSGAAAANYAITYKGGTLTVVGSSAPVASARTVTTAVNRPVTILLEGRSSDGSALRYALHSPPSHGRLTGEPPRVLYVPADHYVGEDSFEFTVSAGDRVSEPATVVVRVEGVEPRVSGMALEFDGANDVVNVDGGIALANQSMTLEAWVRPAVQGVNNFFLAQGNGGPNVTLHVGFMPTGVLRFGFGNNDLDTPRAFAELEWHHWAFVYSTTGRSKRIYRDGVLVASGSGGQLYGGSGRLTIGATPQLPSFFNGRLDEVRIWRVARSAEDIAANYRRQVRGDEAGLVGYWRFDEGSGVVAARTGNSEGTPAGALQGGARWVESGVSLGLAPPVIRMLAPTRGGRGIQLSFPGLAGGGYLVEASSDLLNWEAVGGTETGADGQQEYEDAEWAPHERRFFRVRAP